MLTVRLFSYEGRILAQSITSKNIKPINWNGKTRFKWMNNDNSKSLVSKFWGWPTIHNGVTKIYVGHQPTATLLFSGLGSAVNKIYETKHSHSPQAELKKFKWMNRCI